MTAHKKNYRSLCNLEMQGGAARSVYIAAARGSGTNKMWAPAVAVWCLVAASGARAGPPPMDEDMAELAGMVRDSCAAETGVRLDLVEQVNAGAPLMEDATLKCYIKCVMETAGMLSDGAVDLDVVLSLLDDATRAHNEAALRACGTVPGADLCDTAWRTQRCWQQANPEQYFLI